MSSSSSQSYGSSFNWNWPRPEIVNCNHDLEAELVISRTAANPGRRYYRCRIWKVNILYCIQYFKGILLAESLITKFSVVQEDDCKFFRWVDAGLSPSQDSYFQRVKLERDQFESQLRAKSLIEGVLEEKLHKKSEECEALKLQLAMKTDECGALTLKIANTMKTSRRFKFTIVLLCIVIFLLL